MTNEFKETIRELIRKAKTDKALQELLNWAHRNNDEALTDKVTELTAQFKKTNNDVMYGYITDNEADVKQRRLVNTILMLLQEIGENKATSDVISSKSEDKVLPKVEERKTLKIFLASSYELKADRESFELHFGARKRKTFSRDIEVVLWEDFIDAMSNTRLQDEYNKAVKDCDMFVMLFFTKVGKYTAEEFETAFGQFKDNGKPLIYTYFKNADVKMGDINDDILSMLTFKNKLRDLGHFVTEYANPTDLNFQFSNQLDKLLKDNRI
jgi:Effector-associated domain 11